MSRAPKQPIIYQEKLKVPEKFLRFATPKEVALYRAERLKCDTIAELGAGIGGQTIAFAKTCKKVIAVEIDKNKIKILESNLKKLGIKNVELILGSSLDENIIKRVSQKKPNVIFCDTERPEKAERTLDRIKPSVNKILEEYSQITEKIAIEIPPLTKDIENIKTNYSFEKEFISLNKQLNRLTLYFGKLKQDEVSAISLPSREKIIYSNPKKVKDSNQLDNYKYLYTVDPTIIISNLLQELSKKYDAQSILLDKPVLFSNKKINSAFLTGYEILSKCKNDKEIIIQELKKLNAKTVVLNYKVAPEDYWKIRNSYENELSGNKEICLFIDDKENDAILTEKLKN